MSPTELVVPKKPNGRNDWPGAIRTLWPILIAIVVFVAWAGQRLEDADQKQDRIDKTVGPVIADVVEIKAAMLRHESTLSRIDVNVALIMGRLGD